MRHVEGGGEIFEDAADIGLRLQHWHFGLKGEVLGLPSNKLEGLGWSPLQQVYQKHWRFCLYPHLTPCFGSLSYFNSAIKSTKITISTIMVVIPQFAFAFVPTNFNLLFAPSSRF